MAGRFSVEAIFSAKDRMTRPVARMSSRIQRMTRSAGRSMRNLDRAFGNAHRTIARTGAVVGAAALATTLALATLGKSGADFEQAITNVAAVGLQTRAQIAPLEQMALDLGATTKFTATEAANAMEIMARAGFKADAIIAGVPGVLNAAAASGLEIAEVADHVSNALKGMGLATSDAGRVADVLALASSRTNSTIGTLGESLRNVASTARELGVPLEDVVASVALLQDVGLDASVAGSAMNTMLTKLAKPPAAIAKQMKRMGLSFKDAKGNMKAFPDVLATISTLAEKSGGSLDRVAVLADLVGLRGQKAASNLSTLFESGKIADLTAALQDASGAAKEMASIRMDTLQGDITLLGSAWDGLTTAMYNTEGGPLRDIVQATTKWITENKQLIVSGLGDFLASVKDHLPEIVKGLKLLGGGLAVFYTWAAAVKVASVAMAAFNFVVAANPIGLLLIALSAAAVAIYAFWDDIGPWAESAMDDLTGTVGSAWDWLKSAARATAEFIVGAFALAFPNVTGIAVATWKAVRENWEPAKRWFSDLWDGIVDTATSMVDRFLTITKPIRDFFGWRDQVRGEIGSWVGDKIGALVDNIRKAGRHTLGAASDGRRTEDNSGGPQVMGPQERAARLMSHSISETLTFERNQSEITIRDESGRAEVTRQPRKGPSLIFAESGAF